MEIELIKCDGPCGNVYSANMIKNYEFGESVIQDAVYCDSCAAEADAAHEDKDEDNIPL